MSWIELEEMEFHAKHGCFAEERLTGNKFNVTLSFEADTANAEISDKLTDTVNYQTIFFLVKKEMDLPSNLLEHVANRITESILNHYSQIIRIKVKVSKMNPALGGKMKCVSVNIAKTRDDNF